MHPTPQRRAGQERGRAGAPALAVGLLSALPALGQSVNPWTPPGVLPPPVYAGDAAQSAPGYGPAAAPGWAGAQAASRFAPPDLEAQLSGGAPDVAQTPPAPVWAQTPTAPSAPALPPAAAPMVAPGMPGAAPYPGALPWGAGPGVGGGPVAPVPGYGYGYGNGWPGSGAGLPYGYGYAPGAGGTGWPGYAPGWGGGGLPGMGFSPFGFW